MAETKEFSNMLIKMSEKIKSLLYQIGLIADYVVEQGTNDYGSYRKWSSGKAEVWFNTSGTASTAAAWSTPVYYKDYTTWSDCFDLVCSGIFNAAPANVTVTSNGSQWFSIYPHSISKSGIPTMRFLTITSKTDIAYKFSLYAVGTWEEISGGGHCLARFFSFLRRWGGVLLV